MHDKSRRNLELERSKRNIVRVDWVADDGKCVPNH